MATSIARTFTRWAIFLSALALSLGATWLAVSFSTGHTAFVTKVGLADPWLSPLPAGWVVSLVIACLFATACWVGFIAYTLAIFIQNDAYVTIHDIWAKATPGLIAGSVTAAEVLARMAKATRRNTRLAAVLASWPDADARMVIEKSATPYRECLAIVHTSASILVLVGLVGNFFGLSHAVMELPGLLDSPAPQAAPLPETQSTTSSLPGTSGITVTRTSHRDPTAPPVHNDAMKTRVASIAEGLSTVVISSVMGIITMALLTLYAGVLRGAFNAQLTDEVALMAGEIAPALAPGHNQHMLDRLDQVLVGVGQVPVQLERFTKEAAKFTTGLKTMSDDMNQVVKQLDVALRTELHQTHEAYERYEKSLDGFTEALGNQQGAMTLLVANSTGIAASLASTAENSATLQDQLKRSQQEYENYLQLARSVIESDAARRDAAQQRIVEESRRAMEGFLQQAQAAVSQIDAAIQRWSDGALQETRNGLATVGSEVARASTQALSDNVAQILTTLGPIRGDMRDQLGEWQHLRREVPDLMARLREMAGEVEQMQARFGHSMSDQVDGLSTQFRQLGGVVGNLRRSVDDLNRLAQPSNARRWLIRWPWHDGGEG